MKISALEPQKIIDQPILDSLPIFPVLQYSPLLPGPARNQEVQGLKIQSEHKIRRESEDDLETHSNSNIQSISNHQGSNIIMDKKFQDPLEDPTLGIDPNEG